MPWSQEQLKDAMQILSEALEQGSLEKVRVGEESYVVANGTTYTDEIYLEALEEMKSKDGLKATKLNDERESYSRGS